jgi:hypothetical protein
MRRLWLALCVCCGCSFKVDTAAPAITLVGAAPIVTGPRIALGTGESLVLMQGADGNAWVARTSLGNTTLDCLTVAAPTEKLGAAALTITTGSVYLLTTPKDPMMPDQLTIHRPGDTLPDHQFQIPRSSKGKQLEVSGDGELFATWDLMSPTFRLQRRDETYGRDVPMGTPKPGFGAGFWFSESGTLLFHEEACGSSTDPDCATVIASATDSASDRSLGQIKGQYRPSDRAGALVVCNDTGLSLVPFDGSTPRVLDGDTCASLFQNEGASPVSIVAGALYYLAFLGADTELRRVPLDGSAPPTAVYDGHGLIFDLGPPGALYSTTPFIFDGETDATDGWLGNWQFMERGRGAKFDATFSRIHWLEHTAREYSVGDLLSAPVTQGDSRPLALNVADFRELSDGRLLAADDQAFLGPQNRVVVIDEAAGVARWVADRAVSFTGIPGTTDLAIQLIRDDGDFELVQLPLPATPE